MDQHADWQFVTEHWETVTRYCRNLAKLDSRIVLDDLIQEVALDLSTSFRLYDSKRGKPSNLIFMRVRRARHRYVTSLNRNNHVDINDDHVEDHICTLNPKMNMDTLVLLGQCMSAANQKQSDAIRSYLDGDKGNEVNKSIGCTPQMRSMRVKQLAEGLGLR